MSVITTKEVIQYLYQRHTKSHQEVRCVNIQGLINLKFFFTLQGSLGRSLHYSLHIILNRTKFPVVG